MKRPQGRKLPCGPFFVADYLPLFFDPQFVPALRSALELLFALELLLALALLLALFDLFLFMLKHHPFEIRMCRNEKNMQNLKNCARSCKVACAGGKEMLYYN